MSIIPNKELLVKYGFYKGMDEKSVLEICGKKFYQQNLRVKDYLPNRTPRQHIFLNLPIEQGSSTFKKTIEKLTNNKF